MTIKSLSEGYQTDFSTGRTEVDGDGMFYVRSSDASVDGQGGSINDKPVFTIDQAKFQLNRGDGLITVDGVTYRSGANWYGAQGTATNNYYDLPVSKTLGADGVLKTLNFGFYETKATLPDPYVYTQLADGTDKQYIGFAVANGFSAFDADQRVAAREAIDAWDELISVNFVETPFAQADINFMNTTTGPIQASAYLPYDYGATNIVQDDGTKVTYEEISGDVFVNPNQASNHLFDEGQYGLTTLIHELGHTLGLEHPGAYNFSANFTATYENGAEYYQDSNQYSIMSYWDAEKTGAQHVDWNNLTYRYSSTASVHDIAAVQAIYGADTTTRKGDTVYGFNSTAGKESFDFVKTPAPVVTIWDAGGNDTLDLSGYKTPSVIDLNPGAFSSAGGTVEFLTLDQINANRAAEGLAPRTQATLDLYNELFKDEYGLTNGLMKDNISIAYGATIENAIGGSGNDVITGNAVSNKLSGGGGNDRLAGGDKVDYLTGGLGADTFVAEVTATKVSSKAGKFSFDVITDFSAGDKIDVDALGDFIFKGTSANKGAGDLTYTVYDSVNGAESALGIDIDGVSGKSTVKGPVTVVFGDVNGGGVDFAVALLNKSGVSASDFIGLSDPAHVGLSGTGGLLSAHSEYMLAA
jgi:serralysin